MQHRRVVNPSDLGIHTLLGIALCRLRGNMIRTPWSKAAPQRILSALSAPARSISRTTQPPSDLKDGKVAESNKTYANHRSTIIPFYPHILVPHLTATRAAFVVRAAVFSFIYLPAALTLGCRCLLNPRPTGGTKTVCAKVCGPAAAQLPRDDLRKLVSFYIAARSCCYCCNDRPLFHRTVCVRVTVRAPLVPFLSTGILLLSPRCKWTRTTTRP